MKRIPKSLIGVLLTILLMSGSTLSYSSYAEASAGTSPASGKPDLKIISDGAAACIFQLPNVAPGDSGHGSNKLVNVGSLAGELGVGFSEVINTPGTSGEYADGSGDLGANAEIAVYIDVDASGDWNGGDIGLKSDGTTYSHPTALDYDAIDNYGGVSWNAVETMTASAADDFIVMWRIPITVGNEIQGDSVSLDITFVLEQATAD